MEDFQQTLDENQNLAEALQTQQNIIIIQQLREEIKLQEDDFIQNQNVLQNEEIKNKQILLAIIIILLITNILLLLYKLKSHE